MGIFRVFGEKDTKTIVTLIYQFYMLKFLEKQDNREL